MFSKLWKSVVSMLLSMLKSLNYYDNGLYNKLTNNSTEKAETFTPCLWLLYFVELYVVSVLVERGLK